MDSVANEASARAAIDFAPGVRIGVDVGTVRVGIAASDLDGIMAFPLGTVNRAEIAAAEVAAIARERSAVSVFVGLPRTLKGQEGASAADARDFAKQLAEHLDAPVRLIDERFSSATASHAMSQAGLSVKQQRNVVDQQAAVVILENALDTEKRGNINSVTEPVSRKGRHD